MDGNKRLIFFRMKPTGKCQRRPDMGRIFIAFVLLWAVSSCARVSVIDDMRVEWSESPICVDTQTPRFTWTYNAAFTQSSFEIEVSSVDGSRVWTSGPVASGEMNYIPDDEMGLHPMTSYTWRVVANGTDGRTVVSDDARFETALFSGEDWLASWISDGRSRDEETAPVLKREFVAAEGFSKARLYVSAAAYADFSINGKPVFSSPLNPAYTDYGKRNLYITKDVTDFLKPGENEMFAVLGNGFYNVIDHVAVWDFDMAEWRGRARMIAQLYVEYPDGKKYIIGTDSAWKALADPRNNPYRMNNIYSGDTYDCRIPSPGPSVGTPDSLWTAAIPVSAPSPVLRAQYVGENVAGEVICGKVHYPEGLARDKQQSGDMVAVCDFGVNISGLTSFTVEGEPGAVVKVQHGERLDGNGRLDVSHMDEHFRPKPNHEFQTDVFVLSDGENAVGDRFSYDGFRYAELRSDTPFSVKSAEASFIHTDLRRSGTFESSDSLLNGIHRMVIQSYLSNNMGIPTDCPQREKNGWTADGWVSCEIGLLNFESANLYLKWIDDIVDNQRPDGQICGIVPSHGWGFGIGPVWDAVLFVVPEKLYDYTGDIRGIRKAARACRNYLGYLATRESADGSIEYGLGDWVFYRTGTPNAYTSTCYYWYELQTMARFERLLGNSPEPWQTKADAVRDLINSRWLDSGSGTYANGSQTAQSLALYLGIVPDGKEEKVVERLLDAVHAAGDHLDCGMIGSKTLLRMLTKFGHPDLAFSVATAETEPSWAYWRKLGYSTMPEQWVAGDGVRLSMNHVFLGDIDAWMYNDIAGINCDPQKPGFRNIVFRPHFIKQLKSVSASCRTASGLVSLSWKRSADRVFLEVVVPGNTEATLIAGGREEKLGAGKHKFTF